MEAGTFISLLERLGTPGLSTVAFVGLVTWMARELLRMRRELSEQRLLRERGVLDNIQELGELKGSISPEKLEQLEAFVTKGFLDNKSHPQPSFWWAFWRGAAIGLVVTATRYAIVLWFGDNGAVAPVALNVLTPKGAFVNDQVFKYVSMVLGIFVIPASTGYFVGKYQGSERDPAKLVVLATIVAMALPFAYAILVLLPMSLLL